MNEKKTFNLLEITINSSANLLILIAIIIFKKNKIVL